MKPLDVKLVNWAIAQFEAIDPASSDAYNAAIKIFQLIGSLPSLFDDLQAGERLCRARTHSDAILYTDIAGISVPPKSIITPLGRCNSPGNRMFYCSEDRGTSYGELVHSWRDNINHYAPIYATIGAWHTLRPMKLLIVPSPDVRLRKSRFDRHYGMVLDTVLQRMHISERPAFELFYQYLFYKFSQDAKDNKHPHVITSAYSEFVLAQAGNFADGIMYPSVYSKTRGLNFAIRANLITPTNIELRTVLRDKLRRIDKPPFIPDFEQTEYIQACRIDLVKREIGWCSYANVVILPTITPPFHVIPKPVAVVKSK